MTTEINLMEITAVLEEMRAEMAALAARLARLEESITAASASAPALTEANVDVPAADTAAVAPEAAPEPSEEEPISEETLLAIAAAVAAYLGERAHIRQVRLIRTGAWAQEGRVSIQASHRLH
jgi:methylmalonyl-CoA carboxyltransferase large subunit